MIVAGSIAAPVPTSIIAQVPRTTLLLGDTVLVLPRVVDQFGSIIPGGLQVTSSDTLVVTVAGVAGPGGINLTPSRVLRSRGRGTAIITFSGGGLTPVTTTMVVN